MAATHSSVTCAARVTQASGQREGEAAAAARGFALQVNGVLRRLCAHRDSLLAPEPPPAPPASPEAAATAAAAAAAASASASAFVSLDAAIARLERTRALLQLERSDCQPAPQGTGELSAALVALTSAQ